MNIVRLFGKNHEYQKPGLCGPASVRVSLKCALEYQKKAGIISEQHSTKVSIPSQKEISEEVLSGPIIPKEDITRKKMSKFILPEDQDFYQKVGMKTYCLPEDLSKFLGVGATYVENETIENLKAKLKKKIPAIVLWQEEIPDRHIWFGGGHWSIAVAYNSHDATITMVDSSRSERRYDANGKPILGKPRNKDFRFRVRNKYRIKASYFAHNWYDSVEETGKVYRGVAIYLDLARLSVV
jgi:hypothetical protein